MPSGSPSTWSSCAEIRRQSRRLRDGWRRRISDRQTADLSRCGQILFQQRRRKLQNVRNIVEAVAFVVGGQEIGDIDVQGQQIPNRIAVFGAIQAMDGRPAGIGFRCSRRDREKFPAMRSNLWTSSLAGRGRPVGGIIPPRSLRITFSQVSALLADVVEIHFVEHQPAVLARSL